MINLILPTWSTRSTWSYPQGRASWLSLEVLPRRILAVRSVVCRWDTFFDTLIFWNFDSLMLSDIGSEISSLQVRYFFDTVMLWNFDSLMLWYFLILAVGAGSLQLWYFFSSVIQNFILKSCCMVTTTTTTKPHYDLNQAQLRHTIMGSQQQLRRVEWPRASIPRRSNKDLHFSV